MRNLRTLVICYTLMISAIAFGDIATIQAPNSKSYKNGIACVDPNIADLKKRADANDGRAIISLADCYIKGRGVPRDNLMAEKLFKKLAATNKPYYQFDLAIFYSVTLDDYQMSAEYYTRAAEQGFIPAKTNLAVQYMYGQGVKQDYAKATTLFQEAATQGDSIAQFWLAQAYVSGKGVKQDQRKAFEWMSKAAASGHATAQSYLGDMYATGFAELPRNYKEAIKWYKKSAAQGNELGEYNLGVSYSFGQGVEKNDKLATKWFLKAAEQGYPAAQYNAGAAYVVGKGVKQDGVKAYMWLTLSAENGFSKENANPKDILNRLRNILSPSEIAEANQLVAEHKRTHGRID